MSGSKCVIIFEMVFKINHSPSTKSTINNFIEVNTLTPPTGKVPLLAINGTRKTEKAAKM